MSFFNQSQSPRKNPFPDQMAARFAAGTLDRIAAAKDRWEMRSDFVRKAVENEIKARAAAKAPKTLAETLGSIGGSTYKPTRKLHAPRQLELLKSKRRRVAVAKKNKGKGKRK